MQRLQGMSESRFQRVLAVGSRDGHVGWLRIRTPDGRSGASIVLDLTELRAMLAHTGRARLRSATATQDRQLLIERHDDEFYVLIQGVGRLGWNIYVPAGEFEQLLRQLS